MNPKDFQHELMYFDEVKEIIRTKINILQDEKNNLRQQVLKERKDMWADSRHAIHDFDDVVELNAQDWNVSDAENRFERNMSELRRMERIQRKPYFGRIDFTESNGRCRTIYIGIHSLINDEPHKIYVVDWRAPAASMFYSFDLGPANYETQSQTRNVLMTLKRQYEIAEGQLKYAYDTDSSMHDSILGEVLSQNTSEKLRVIIGSIQKEQNYAIRSHAKQNCLIYGLAGSGKTSVGLHRLAYLLYQNRDTIASDNILILSNNEIFSSYVSAILPELGENPAETLVFRDLLLSGLNGEFRVEDYYDQLEYLDGTSAEDGRAVWIKRKYSPELLRYFEAYFANFPFRVPEIRYKGDTVFSQEIFYAKWENTRNLPFKQSYDMVCELIKRCIEDYFVNHQQEVCQDLKNSHDEFLLKNEIPHLFQKTKRRCVEYALAEFAAMNQLEPQTLLTELMQKFFHSVDGTVSMLEELTSAFVRKKLWYEDALLLLLIKTLMGSIPVKKDILHIVIDEAQDYNPIQIYMMRYLYPRSTFTLLADTYQSVNPYTTIREYDSFDTVFGNDLKKICLEKTYRSTSEINALAFQLINAPQTPIRERYSYFERHGQKPVLWVEKNLYAEVETVLSKMHSYNTLAIITNSTHEVFCVEQYLKNLENFPFEMQVICSPKDKITKRLVVIPLLLAKGLEFDGVILTNLITDNADNPDLRRKVYLGCTRALHELYLLETAELPSVLEDCLPYFEEQS